jgi:hypothetical protein
VDLYQVLPDTFQAQTFCVYTPLINLEAPETFPQVLRLLSSVYDRGATSSADIFWKYRRLT